MDQPVTNDACESRRCEMRKLIKEEVRDVMATVNDNKTAMNDWIIRLERKMDDNQKTISDKVDDLQKLMMILILAIALGAIGLRLGWI